jgi:NYN domain-containing protein
MKANLDIELVVDLFRLADRMDIAVIVSGDGDFAPAIRALQDKGVRAEVISFKPNTSSDLIAVADEFMDIMKVASISRKKGETATRASMSAPEMPAKEVSPEFGFREASPSVAAAALAAIKGGPGGAGNGRRTRGGPSRRTSVIAEETSPERGTVAAPVSDAASDASEEVRRRRRRRGGRGRGRSRREDEAAPVTTGGEEIGWEEFDDLAQLDGGDEDHEYTFEEADAATLAELGIDATVAAPAEPAPQAEDGSDAAPETTPKRRTRSTKATATAATRAAPKRARASRSTASEGDASADAKPTRSRATRTTRKPTDDAEAPGTATATPPKRRTRAKPAADQTTASEDGGGAEGEPQGIWGRFRSARKPRGTAG